MSEPSFEVELSQEFIERIESDLLASVSQLAGEGAFSSYNRGGGPGGSYDRHYDRSTGIEARSPITG